MNWQDYFEACGDNDICKAFDALADIGVLPVVNGEDVKGKLKRPMAKEGWEKLTTAQWTITLNSCLRNGIPFGIGAKPVGYLVIDVDPKDKDSGNLPDAWREMSQLVFGSDDPPKTMIVRTENGAHVWFKIDDGFQAAWGESGRKKIKLKCGGSFELFVGVPNGGYQVACAPSEGKKISIAMPPIKLPKSAQDAIIKLVTAKPVDPKPVNLSASQDEIDLAWVKDAMDSGYLDSEVDDYDSWLRVGMALFDRFGETGSELWETWSNRSGKHIANECFSKVKSFKRSGGNVVKFGSLIAIVQRNGGTSPNNRPKASEEATEFLGDEDLLEASNAQDILDRMKERKWLWGDKEKKTGWLQQGGLHLVEGREGTGKTRWIMDLVRRWSLDLVWPDGTKIEIDPDSKVLFVASDSHWDQIALCAEDFGIPPENVLFTGPKTDPYDFTSIDEKRTAEIIRLWCRKYKIALIVVDTLMAATSRPLVDRQECAMIANPLRAIAREFDVTVVMVGHLNNQGETYGRAMQGNCEHVIRLEANEADKQHVTIKSEKCRWNKFALPVLNGRQHENGWEYTSTNSDEGSTPQVKGREAAADVIRRFMVTVSRVAWGEMIDELAESGVAKTTANRALKFMVESGELVVYKEKFPSGKECSFYEINPHFITDDQSDLVPKS
jgi:hypothetical protein